MGQIGESYQKKQSQEKVENGFSLDFPNPKSQCLSILSLYTNQKALNFPKHTHSLSFLSFSLPLSLFVCLSSKRETPPTNLETEGFSPHSAMAVKGIFFSSIFIDSSDHNALALNEVPSHHTFVNRRSFSRIFR